MSGDGQKSTRIDSKRIITVFRLANDALEVEIREFRLIYQSVSGNPWPWSRGLLDRLSRGQLGARVGRMADDRSESAPGSLLILHLSTQLTVWGILRPDHGVLVLTLTGVTIHCTGAMHSRLLGRLVCRSVVEEKEEGRRKEESVAFLIKRTHDKWWE